MESILNQNPEMYIDTNPTYSGIIRKTDRLLVKENLFQQCRKVLLKTYQSRIPSDNQTLLKLVQKSDFLKEIAEFQGLDFLKGILRNAKLQIIDEKQVVAEQDMPLNYMVIVLQGKLGIEKPSLVFIKDQNDKNNDENDQGNNQYYKTSELLQKLTFLARKERDLQKKQSKLQRKSTIPVSQYDFMLPVLTNDDYEAAVENLQGKVALNEEFGGKLRLRNQSYNSRVFALQKTTILVFQISFLFYWLELSFKAKLNKNIQKIKLLPAFDIIEQQKIAEIIISMKLIRKKKGDIVYSEGDEAQMLYVLVDGELKLSKEINLFKENPNDFYVDRRKLIRHLRRNEQARPFSKSKNEQSNILPFANLTSLYNYRPMKKSTELGMLSSYGIFGAEELIFKTNRQTTIAVNSLEVAYYQIQFKKILQIIGPKISEKFKESLEHSLGKKILYRQKEFADNIRLQNKSNLDYFYIQKNEEKDSPRKMKLDKINDKIRPTISKDLRDHAPAFYTTFNFNKMFVNKSRYSLQKSTRKLTNQSSTEEDQSVDCQLHNECQSMIIEKSHSWKPMEKKVKQQSILSKKISPLKHKININEPLIDQEFFKDMQKEKRRINKEFRCIKLSLGKRIK